MKFTRGPKQRALLPAPGGGGAQVLQQKAGEEDQPSHGILSTSAEVAAVGLSMVRQQRYKESKVLTRSHVQVLSGATGYFRCGMEQD